MVPKTAVNTQPKLTPKMTKEEQEIFQKSFHALTSLFDSLVEQAMEKEGGALLFTTFINHDGAGDIGHFIDVCKQETLNKVSGLQHFNVLRLVMCPSTLEKEIRGRLQKADLLGRTHIIFYNPELRVSEHLSTLLINYLDSHGEFRRWMNELIAVFNVSTDIMVDLLNIAGVVKPGISTVNLGEHGGASIKLSFEEGEHKETSDTAFANNAEFRHMGFSNKHHGIFIDTPKVPNNKAECLAQIKDVGFLKLLTKSNSSQFDSKHTTEFLKKSMLIPGYFQGGPGSFVMIYLSVLGSDLARYQEFNEVVFVVNSGNFAEERVNLAALKNFKVKDLEVVEVTQTPQGVHAKTKITHVSPYGMNLRIIQNYKLESDEDYENLVKSAHLYGCSGDKSFEMAVSNKIIPLFQAKHYKRSFLIHFGKVAKAVESHPKKPVSNYLEQIGFLTPEIYRQLVGTSEYFAIPNNISKVLNFDLLEAWPKLVDYLHKHYNYNNALPLILKQTLCHALIGKFAASDPTHIALRVQINALEHELTKKEQADFTLLMEKVEANKLGATLDLSRCNLSPSNFVELCHKLQSKQKLTSIVLEANHYTMQPQAIKALSELMLKHRSIETLDLGLNGIDDETLKSLMPALQLNPIKHLDLSINPLKLEGFKCIAKLIKESKTLKYLLIMRTSPCLDAIKTLTEAIATSNTLEGISFRYCDLNNQSATLLASAMERNKTITTVALECNYAISDQRILTKIANLTKRNEQAQSFQLLQPSNSLGMAMGMGGHSSNADPRGMLFSLLAQTLNSEQNDSSELLSLCQSLLGHSAAGDRSNDSKKDPKNNR